MMIKTRLALIACAAIVTAFPMATYAGEGHDHGRPYNYMPQGGYKSTTNSRYVEASAETVIGKDEKVAGLFDAAVNGQTLVQRLTERSYWVFTGNYNTTFYVGDEGVLLLDPLGADNAPKVLDAVASVTDKPVRAVVYSHNHADHIDGIHVFFEHARQKGYQLDIIATDKTVAKQKFLKSTLPASTIILPFVNGSMKFENQTLRVHGFEHAAHTDDSAMWILEEEGILHIPDHVNPDQMPFLGFGGSENYVYYRHNLESIANAQWEIFSSGHGNVGRKADIDFMMEYLDDLEHAAEKASTMVDWDALFAAQPNNHEALMHSYAIEHSRIGTNLLREKYGEYYGFEASVPYQVDMASGAMASYK